MKQYLMTGIAALTLCAGFTSCSHDDFEPITQEQIDKAKYDQAFLAYVGGHIASEQTWGFSSAVNARFMTRASQPNRNEWGKEGTIYADVVVPDDVTPAEAAYVMEWFRTHGKADGTTLDLHDYFVQHVGYGGNSYTKDATYYETYESGAWKTRVDNVTVEADAHMDYLYANLDNESKEYDHFYNFNTDSGDIMLMWGSETKYGFGFNESYGTDKTHVYENYLLAEITVPGSCFEDNQPRTGFYVGFDYETLKLEHRGAAVNTDWVWDDEANYIGHNVETVVEEETDYEYIHILPNGVYDDRVVKIVPAKRAPEGDLRIIAEDLCADEDGDFDFNDIVLDVKYGNPATLILQAAGGTLPLRIAENDDWEVHKLFKVDVDYMVNTNARAKGLKGNLRDADPVEFQYTGAINSPEEANGIKLEVFKNGTWQELKAPKGEPASKLAVGTSYNWLDELVSIKGTYPLFVTWADSEPFMSMWWTSVTAE
ncbi:MAG: hypothetical protein IJ533_09405 [Prevotella sp.]|nr:hypothetical protein [Prevotella sp.]